MPSVFHNSSQASDYTDVSGGQAGPAGSQKVWHKFSKAEEGKFNHKIAAPDSSYKNEFNFKLNEEGSTTFNGSDIKVSQRFKIVRQ